MASIGKTIAGLSRYRRYMKRLHNVPRGKRTGFAGAPSRLREVRDFGSNPGALRMMTHVPERLTTSPAMVVVLHGCTQTAAGYDHGAGWSALADRHGFAVLFPEQQTSNNPNNCFTWFQATDTTRGLGEALSIRQMVEAMARAHGIDRSRIFITGLSAGGAMTSVMLAAYPEVFAGGAILAGLPYGAAENVQEAFQAMFQGTPCTPKELGNRVRSASPHSGPWPRVSVWHGTEDATVVQGNADEIVKQWCDVHGLPQAAHEEHSVAGHTRRIWRDADGESWIEDHRITGMAHGTPLDTRPGAQGKGVAGPFMLEAGISSTWHIARFWGLLDGAEILEPEPHP